MSSSRQAAVHPDRRRSLSHAIFEMRPRQVIMLGTGVFLVLCVYSILRSAPATGRAAEAAQKISSKTHGTTYWTDTSADGRADQAVGREQSHPILYLIASAEREQEEVRARQSGSLEEAVAEYRRRYGIPPPPKFDEWWKLAQKRGVLLVDEYDTIHELMTPFWGLRPETIRARAAESLGFDNGLMGVRIRDGKVVSVKGGPEWMEEAVAGMLRPFARHLPGMDLALNVHDEPRVLVPAEDMDRLVKRAKTVTMPAAMAVARPRNDFSPHSTGTGGKDTDKDDSRPTETKLTRFNSFPHQSTWTHSRLACPADSPARALEEADRVDVTDGWALGELGFVYNETAQSDVCMAPSLGRTFGFFGRPNYYSVVTELFPVFSQSKISSYADIIYPSPWYWDERVRYEEGEDPTWAKKAEQLYWRGSTTGGFSRNGGWRRQHRQRMVSRINAVDRGKILVVDGGSGNRKNKTDSSSSGGGLRVEQVPRGYYRRLTDVHFSHIGQCDAGDCAAQRQFFDVREPAAPERAYRHRHVLDVDGNAFSGRFYALLRSRSLVWKAALFREWHRDWLRAWVHYVPVSQRGDEILEAVRFLVAGEAAVPADARRAGERMAKAGRDWAAEVLRREDMELWFFRLLLEYGRVIDDDREKIGFTI